MVFYQIWEGKKNRNRKKKDKPGLGSLTPSFSASVGGRRWPKACGRPVPAQGGWRVGMTSRRPAWRRPGRRRRGRAVAPGQTQGWPAGQGRRPGAACRSGYRWGRGSTAGGAPGKHGWEGGGSSVGITQSVVQAVCKMENVTNVSWPWTE